MQIESQALTLILASNNSHKVREIRSILEDTNIIVRPLSEFPHIPDPPETGHTFRANALQKAHYVFKRTGLPTIADDSGLSVDALNGAPGVYSKRYTPEATAIANNKKLLHAMDGQKNRTARFTCAMAIVCDAGEQVLMGHCEGQIATICRGEGGFGYDPLFVPKAYPSRHMAELTDTEKNAISHRGESLKTLKQALMSLRLLDAN